MRSVFFLSFKGVASQGKQEETTLFGGVDSGPGKLKEHLCGPGIYGQTCG